MIPLELTETNFAEVVKAPGMVLVDFWAAWCGPCRQFAPVFDQAAELHPDVVFGKVNTETQQSLAAAAQITSIPTLLAFKDGVMVSSRPGALDPARLESLVTSLKELDMDEVRSRMQIAPR
ncbi:thioredoxin [Glutamicibacter sp. MNS18]|uniref:thioredoxin n=1 Tax=Glutamicibacter sp. MNS18 TaxID=2989817 RepID=UPI0022364514|nr:thioredoxin [Glutamicibacter sp. MNS18]MCW4466066.1 thioredoxin [Glutamicibacter sp. MNS18]